MSRMNLSAGNAGYRRESKPTAEDNTQPRFELFLLGEGEKKVTEEADTREFSYLSWSKTAAPCCFYLSPSTARKSLLSIINGQDIVLVPFRLHLTSLHDFAKRLFRC